MSAVKTRLLGLENVVVPNHYSLELEIDPAGSNFRGCASIELGNKFGKAFRTIELHAKDLVVAKAELNGGKTLKISYDKINELVVFKSDVDISGDDKDLVLKLEYVGKIKNVQSRRDVTTGVFKSRVGNAGGQVIATHCQPCFARNIFPCIDEPSSKATFQLSIKTLSRFKVMSNSGVLEEKKCDFDNSKFKTVCFKKTCLMTTSVFGFVIGDFEFVKSEIKLPVSNRTIPVTVYATTNVTDATFTLDTVQKYLPILESYFNKAFAFDKIDFVLLPFLSDMAMENFGMITILMDHLLLPPKVLAIEQVRNQVQQLIVHELVHQWMGNHISFDSWEHLWFNESFATWLANDLLNKNEDLDDYWNSDEFINKQINSSLDKDIDPSQLSISEIAKKCTQKIIVRSTNEAFNTHSYTKGIILLRSLQLTIGDELLQKALQTVTNDPFFHENSVKPLNLWTAIGHELKSENVTNFFSTWTRSRGFPILHVNVESLGNSQVTKITQHRYYEGESDDIEDVPYHLPLLITKTDGEIDKENVLLTDRSIEIKYPIVLCNNDAQGYYRVSYESQECYDLICDKLTRDELDERNICKIFDDMAAYINITKYQKKIHVAGLMQILEVLTTKDNYWYSLSIGLQLLQMVHESVLKFQSPTSSVHYNYNDKIVSPLIKKLPWPTESPFFNEEKYSNRDMLKVMSQVLFLNLGHNESNTEVNLTELSETYFKHILQGPKEVIPIEMLDSVLAAYAKSCRTIKQQKKLIDITNKSTNGLIPHIQFPNESPVETKVKTVQTIAVQSLGFTTEPDLIDRVLEYIAINIEQPGIELALNGFTHNRTTLLTLKGNVTMSIGNYIFTWYTKKFEEWTRKLIKDSKFLTNLTKISTLALQLVEPTNKDTSNQVESFIKSSETKKSLKPLKLTDLWQTTKQLSLQQQNIHEYLL